MAATSDRLGGLHEMFTAYWEMRMRQASDPDPEKCVPLAASELTVLRAFLKDNGVQADVTGDKELEALANELQEQTRGAVSGDEMAGIMDEFKGFLGGTIQ